MEKDLLYVFSESDCNILKSMGFKCLKEDTKSNVFIFLKDEHLKAYFDSEIVKRSYQSNILTF